MEKVTGSVEELSPLAFRFETALLRIANTVPKLFERDEHERLLKQAEGNPLAIEILGEISARQLVRMRIQKTFDEKREKAWQDWQLNMNQLRKPLRIHIYQKGSVVWYKYPYRYCKSKVVEGSTKVRVQPLRPLPEGEIRIPNLREFEHLLYLKDEEWFLHNFRVASSASASFEEKFNTLYGQWPSEFKFFGYVESPRALLAKLLDLDSDHCLRLFRETQQAIAEGREPSLISRMKTMLSEYSPILYQTLENEQRVKMGKEPIQLVTDLLKIEALEKRSGRNR